jgi:hypothetical protein
VSGIARIHSGCRRRTSEMTSEPSRSASLRSRSSVAVVRASMIAARMSERGCCSTSSRTLGAVTTRWPRA